MSNPTLTPLPAELPPRPDAPPLAARTYGEPRFHTAGDVAAVAFAADGTVFSIDDTGALRHWAADGRPLARHFLSDLETVWAFAPGAALLASGNDDLLLWDPAEGQLVRRLPADAWVTALAFSPDGRTLASGHDDGTVRVWDIPSQQKVGQFAAHPQAVSALAFHPADGRLATAGEDRAVRLWDIDTHKVVGELLSHTDRVPALAWRPDGGLLISAGWDTSARVWKPGEADPVMLLNSHAEQVVAVAFSPSGSVLAAADSDHDVHLWADPERGAAGPVLRGHTDEVRSLAFSPDGSKLATAGADRVVHVWDVATGTLLAGPNPTGRHGVAVFAHAGRPLLASTSGPNVRVWDADTGAELPPTGDGPARSVAAAGNLLAVGGADHFTRLYDLANPATPRRLEATKPPVGAVSLSADGRLLAHTSPADGLVWLWDTATGEPGLILIEAADGCTLEDVAVHPDGRRVVAGGIDYLSTTEDRDGAVCVWDRTTQEKVLSFDVGVTAVAVDPSGKYLAGAGLDEVVHVWDLDAGEGLFDLEGHTGRVNAVAFSPDGSYLVSGGDDLTVRVWDVLSGRLLVVRELDSSVQGLAFGPDGADLYTGNGNTTCYRLPFQKLLDE
jgi:WD40 repeat protein